MSVGTRRVLVCLRYGIGDLVMQLPALETLRRHCADAIIVAVGAEPAIELMEDCSLVDEVVSVHRFGLSHWGDFGDAAQHAAISAWLAAQRFDAVFEPSHAAMGFGQAVWDHGYAAVFDTGLGLQDRCLAHARDGTEALRAAVRSGWGIEPMPRQAPRLFLTAGERTFADGFLREAGLQGRDLVAASPVASSPLKRWPVERLAAAANVLAGHGGAVLLVAAGDWELEHRWAQLAAERFDWVAVPRLHLRQTAALLARCATTVCNDTGVMHLAAAVGSATVGVFGPTSSTVYCPPNAIAASDRWPCVHRQADRFGPPTCVLADECLIGLRSCIDGVSVDTVLHHRAGHGDAATGGHHEIATDTQPGPGPG